MRRHNLLPVSGVLAALLSIGAASAVDDLGSWSYPDADGIEGLVITDIVPTADCGYFMIGYTNRVVFKWYDIFAMKLDQSGEVEWAKAFGGPETEVPLATAAAGDGGFVVLATTKTWGPEAPANAASWLVKLDGGGNIEWERVYDQVATLTRMAGPIDEGGVLVAGAQDRNLLLLAVSPDGEELRKRSIGGPGRDSMVDLISSDDGGYVIAAGSYSFTTDMDVWILKLDENREIDWERAYGQAGTGDHVGEVANAADSGFVVAVIDNPTSTAREYKLLMHLGPAGELLWSSSWDVVETRVNDNIHGVAGMPGGGAALLTRWHPGTTGGDDKVRLWMFDGTGDLLWVKEYSGFLLREEMFDLIRLGDNSLLAAGHRGKQGDLLGKEEPWILRLDQDGLVAGNDCDLVNDFTPTRVPVSIEMTDTEATVADAQVESWETNATIRDLNVTRLEQCSAPACAPVMCGRVHVDPPEVCEGEEVTFALDHACGEGVLDVGWDLDGDGVVDEQGMSVSTSFGPGEHQVEVIVSDSCGLPSPGSCSVSGRARVISGEPPEEVSRRGRTRLRVAPRGEQISVEGPPEVVSYNVYADSLGSWYSPGASTGSQCHLTGPSLPAGTTELDYVVSTGSWLVVTGSTPCAEGPAGPGPEGAERTSQGIWELCGPVP